jgi:23S rRNA (uracil1939-C5)-methyltransferase
MDYEYELGQKRALIIESFAQNGIRDVIANASSTVIASEAKQSSNNLSGLPRRFAPRNDAGEDVRDSNITPVLSDVENALNYVIYDINLVVDPPRAGLDERVVDKILEVTPKKLIYLSCNPVTQARDIAKLLPKYNLVACQSYNFFPRTPHIENLCVLERKND